MKKFLYSLICFFAFGLILLTGIFSYSEISKANAVDSTDVTHTVNFYGADNQTVIYSVEVPDGSSLNDLYNANIVKDSTFSTSISSTIFNNPDKWCCTAPYTLDSNGLTITSATSSNTFLIYSVNDSLYRGKTLVFGFSINNIENVSGDLRQFEKNS